ncbi:MAG: hypothetical protein K6A41_06100 [Bacteroidales bacterium]|nr:hypothetical protein [Bacteroidales bacterium]
MSCFYRLQNYTKTESRTTSLFRVSVEEEESGDNAWQPPAAGEDGHDGDGHAHSEG